MTTTALPAATPRRAFVPTLNKQCWGFMIGSTFFAVGSAPGLADVLGTAGSNILFFIGAWFFTGAGLIQLFLSGAVSVPVSYAPGRMVRAEWLTAATQSFGTLLFNVSTTAALYAKTVSAEEKFVWNPDAGGSVAFLISGAVGFIAYAHTARHWDVRRKEWWSVMINFIGCVAFGFSAVGAYILPGGDVVNGTVASVGTFIGAICFFLTSLIVLPLWTRRRGADVRA
ncbi:hypothetical protein [Microbacterium xanthum]|uniref:hypothetical protein n=1 Tax=Microbacterium xanthum TaxID=3079794 RepID=UPI002AD47EE9|nr:MULTISPECIES: hypothetical protein [unclassified Microbacterium]MDZ8171539.1 hypothetical protein [Microbacterium sp. KSW-48]MDZ8200422.1 hypothetical protein [Microbacterium sp. SSW1-59]